MNAQTQEGNKDFLYRRNKVSELCQVTLKLVMKKDQDII